jgi:hypothetical protein
MPTAKAGAHLLSTSAEHSSSQWGQVTGTGACHTDRGMRGWWGLVRTVGAGEVGGGWRGQWRPSATVPNLSSTLPLWPMAFQIKQNKTKETNQSLRSSSQFQIPNPKNIQTFRVIQPESKLQSTNPYTQSETKEIHALPVILYKCNLLHTFAMFHSPEILRVSVSQYLSTSDCFDHNLAVRIVFIDCVLLES